MRTALVKLKSISPYSQSKYYEVPKLEKEQHAAYEERTWRERLHYDNDDQVYIPPMALKNCLSEAAKYLSIQIPGKGKATYTKHVEAGVLVMTPVYLGIKKDEVHGQWLFVPSDGKRGGGTRVKKCFPIIHEWEGEAEFIILDETVTEEVFKHILSEAGKFIGIGFFRPRNNGFYGRFSVESISWS